jgi:hypothetical protein
LRIELRAITRKRLDTKLCGLMTHYGKKKCSIQFLRHIPIQEAVGRSHANWSTIIANHRSPGKSNWRCKPVATFFRLNQA